MALVQQWYAFLCPEQLQDNISPDVLQMAFYHSISVAVFTGVLILTLLVFLFMRRRLRRALAAARGLLTAAAQQVRPAGEVKPALGIEGRVLPSL